MDGQISDRKIDHIETLLSDSSTDRCKHYFDRIQLRHHALPGIDFAAVDSSVDLLGRRISFPFLISSMTGGVGDDLLMINRNLALAAERAGVAMGVGSQRVMFRDESARESFCLRQYAPSVPLFANLGAVQLNYGFGLDECREAVEVLAGDALILHLNPLQEICQIGGDTDFSRLAEKIGAVVEGLKVPVIVKEVGAGMSTADIERLLENGVEYIDLAGTGGVSWGRVESRRADHKGAKATYAFDDWGVPTPAALEMAMSYADRAVLIASGGLRSGLDVAKAVVMGASLCGMARPLLEPAMDSSQAVLDVIDHVRDEFRRAMFLLGCASVDSMRGRDDLIMKRGS